MNTVDELLTVEEVARILRVDVITVRRWIASGALEAITLPSQERPRYRIKASALNAAMTNTETDA